jgi:hypothetical protein
VPLPRSADRSRPSSGRSRKPNRSAPGSAPCSAAAAAARESAARAARRQGLVVAWPIALASPEDRRGNRPKTALRVSRDWLEQVERDLTELALLRARRATPASDRNPKSLAAATRLLENMPISTRASRRSRGPHDGDRRRQPARRRRRCPDAQGRARSRLAIESWWPHAAPLIAGGKKSVQLGGCMIGTRKSKDKLAHSFESDDKAHWHCSRRASASTPPGSRWRSIAWARSSCCRSAARPEPAIAELGFKIEQGSDQFFVERAQQAARSDSEAEPFLRSRR